MINDDAYANGAYIPGGDQFPARWSAAAERFRASLGERARLNQPYGPAPRNRFDLFMPEAAPLGLLVFVHGGYWLAFSRDSWSHLAAGALARGWACAMPSYTLAPHASLPEMAREVAMAIRSAREMVPGPVVVTGHSAGGHLSARMATMNVDIKRAVPISPLADLAPLRLTAMNEKLRIDEAVVASESPVHLTRNPAVDVHVWVGGQERPAFLWQARLLSEKWSCPWTVAPGRHHFDVIDDLENPTSPLMDVLLAP